MLLFYRIHNPNIAHESQKIKSQTASAKNNSVQVSGS